MRLAIVGASVRAAAESACRAGFDVVGADLFADDDAPCPITQVDRYPEGLVDWLAEQTVDAWLYVGALENHPELVDQMAALAPLWGASGEPLRRARDPWDVGWLIAQTGRVGWPDTRHIDSAAVSGPLIYLAKTYRHAAGAGVWSLDSDADVTRARQAGAAAQQFVAGDSLSAVYLANPRGAVLLGVTRQLLADDGDSRWGYRGSIGPIATTPTEAEGLAAIGSMLADDLKLSGLVGVDLIRSEEGLFAVELNPRYPASAEVLERAVGRSVIGDLARAMAGEVVAPWPHPVDRCAGKHVLFAKRDAIVSDEFAKHASEKRQQGRMADLPHRGERIEAGRPVCTLLADGRTETEVETKLSVAVAMAERRLYPA